MNDGNQYHDRAGLLGLKSIYPHLPLATGGKGNVHETANVLLTLVSASLGPLGLLLRLNLGGLRLDLACIIAFDISINR